MKPKSLVLRTDLVLDRFSGVVTDRGDYLAIKTVSRPDYFWGNYLIMKKPPGSGDLERWLELSENEFGPRDERGFVALVWDSVDGEKGVIEPFSEFGFSVITSSVLTARSVHLPQKFNPELKVRPFSSDEDWEQQVDIHFEPEWDYGDAESQVRFLDTERDRVKAMTDSGLGTRFGVEWEGKLIGDAGIYRAEDLGRFNAVATHRDYRRRGVCTTLIYQACRIAFETMGVETLVIEADEDSPAAHIYESVGFVPTEKLVKLEWSA